MNVVEALEIAKEKGKKVRPKGQKFWKIEYQNGEFIKHHIATSNPITYWGLEVDDILAKWEVVEDENERLNMDNIYEIEELIDEKIEIAKKEIYEKVNRWIDEIW